MPTNDFFKNMVKNIKDDMVTMMEDGLGAGEFTGYIDTGSYVMNAVISADIFGGMHNNKAIALAGESTTGKSFFTMGIMKNYQQQYNDAGIMYYETEGAVNKADMAERGIDVSRVMLGEPTTISEFRTKAMVLLNKYIETPRKERPPLMLVLDSLGMLSTTKEITDITEGNDKKDLTRSQEIRGAFRALRLRMAKAGIPMIITNHTYATMDKYNPQVMGGGGGLVFASDTILMLSKAKVTEGEGADRQVVGNIVHVKAFKNRLARENKRVDVLLTYDQGLDRYYGLLDMAERYKVFKKVSTRFEMPDGSKHFGTQIYREPERFFTKDVLDKINEGVKKEFSYGKNDDTSVGEIAELNAEAEAE